MRTVRIYSVFGVFAVLLLCLMGSQRLPERAISFRSPDSAHQHQLYKAHAITESFVSRADSLSAVGISVSPISTASSERITVTIKDTTTGTILSQQLVSVSGLSHIAFPIQKQSFQKRYEVTLDAIDTPKSQAIYIPYESDYSKDPTTTVTQAGTRKQGSLGLTEYEQPTRALAVWRWFMVPHQRILWAGALVVIIGLYLKKNRTSLLETGTSPEPIYTYVPYFLIIILSCIVVYWPATHLFFYSDDVPILARVQTLWQTHPLLIATPHQYIDADANSQFGFDFYRPVSFSFYPLLLHLIIPTNAALYYFFNILLFAGIGCLLFVIALHILKSKPYALLAVALWAMSSTKLGLLYWWSSSQDLLASFFTMLAFVLYMYDKKRWSLVAFALGLFSKEYVIVLPAVLFLFEWLLVAPQSTFKIGKHITTTLAPYIIVTGLFLIVNTAVLGDPTLPPHKHTDQTYALSSSGTSIIRNIIVYTSASVENRLWPNVPALERPLNTSLDMWQAKTAGPYYPALIVIIVAIASVLLCWKKRNIRNTLIFAIAWWILFLAPILLLANDWKVRWLSLSLFGMGIAIAAIMQRIRTPWVAYCIAVLLVLYGYTVARNPELTRFYREQSAYTREAYNQLKNQEQYTHNEQRIILVGITEDQATSLNAYLFRVFAKNTHAKIVYATSLPDTRMPGDIVINMTGVSAYYPESEK